MIYADRPAGWFADDFGMVEDPPYNRKMPGRKARQTLEKIRKVLSNNR
jgi:hypothetical protein